MTGPCTCWTINAHFHDGHCCFGPRPGESRDEWDARFDRHATGTEPMCHTSADDAGLFPEPAPAPRLLVPVPAQDAARHIDELDVEECYL